METGILNGKEVKFSTNKKVYNIIPFKKIGIYDAFAITKDGQFAIQKAKGTNQAFFIGDVLYCSDTYKINLDAPVTTYPVAWRQINPRTGKPQFIILDYRAYPGLWGADDTIIEKIQWRLFNKLIISLKAKEKVEQYCSTKFDTFELLDDENRYHDKWPTYKGENFDKEEIINRILFKLGRKYMLLVTTYKLEMIIEIPKCNSVEQAIKLYRKKSLEGVHLKHVEQGTHIFVPEYESKKDIGSHIKLPKHPKHPGYIIENGRVVPGALDNIINIIPDDKQWVSKCVEKDGELICSGKTILNQHKIVLGKLWWRTIPTKSKLVVYRKRW